MRVSIALALASAAAQTVAALTPSWHRNCDHCFDCAEANHLSGLGDHSGENCHASQFLVSKGEATRSI